MTEVLDAFDPEYRVWPMLTFHYGIPFSDLMLMPRWMKLEYLRQLPTFIGQERLRAAEVAMLPHVPQETRDVIFANIRRAAGLDGTSAPRIEKAKFDGTLTGIGIGVKKLAGKSRGRVKPKVKPGERMVPLPVDSTSGEQRHPEVTDA